MLEDNLLISKRAAGNAIDPEVHVAIASAAKTQGEAFDWSRSTAATSEAMKRRKHLENQDEDTQHRLWKAFNDNQRTLLTYAGYKLPKHKGGVPHWLTHPFSDVGEAGERAIGAVAKGTVGGIGDFVGDLGQGASDTNTIVQRNKKTPVVGRVIGVTSRGLHDVGAFEKWTGVTHDVAQTAHAVGLGLSGLQHTYRAAELISENHSDTWTDLAGWVAPFTAGIKEWSHAWSTTGSPIGEYSPHHVAHLEDKYGKKWVHIGMRLQSGETLAEILDNKSQQDKDEVARAFAPLQPGHPERGGDPLMQKMLKELDASHLSVGRQLVPAELAVTHPLLHQALSGTIDGLFDWYLDPVVIGTEVTKARMIARWAIEGPKDVEKLYQAKQSVRNEFAMVAEHLKSQRGVDLLAENPRWARLAEPMQKAGVTTGEEVKDWIKDGVGMRALLEGNASGLHAEQVTLPHQGFFGEKTRAMKNWTAGMFDSTAEKNFPFSDFGKKLVRSVPRSGSINLTSEKAGAQVLDYLRQFLPERQARDLTQVFMNASGSEIGTGTRRNILFGAYDEIRKTLGVSDTDWLDIRTKWEQEMEQRFSGPGFDNMTDGVTSENHALDIPELSNTMVLPGVEAWASAIAKKNMLDDTRQAMDWWMSNVWKPSVILRPAFALRAGGEELFQAIARYGVKEMIQAGLAEHAFKNMTPIGHTAAALIPEELAEHIQTPENALAAMVYRAGRGGAREVLAGKFADFAHELSSMPKYAQMYMDSFARDISAMHNPGAMFYPQDLGITMKAPDGRLVNMEMIGTHGFSKAHAGETGRFHYGWRIKLQHLLAGPLRSTALDHIGDEETQVNEVYKTIASKNFDRYRGDFVRNGKDSSLRVVLDPGVRSAARFPDLSEVADVQILGDSVGPNLASSSASGRVIRLNPEAIRTDYEHGLPYLRGRMVDDRGNVLAGSEQKKRVLARMGVNPDKLYEWFENNGGIEKYREFIIAHEKAHIALEHTGTHVGNFLAEGAVRKEIEANNLAFRELEMPFGAGITGVDVRASSASQQEAWRDWAHKVVQDTNALVSGPDGTVNEKLVARLRKGEIPSAEELEQIPEAMKPEWVAAPTMVPVPGNTLRHIVDAGFKHAVGRPMDALIRKRLFFRNFQTQVEEVEKFAPAYKWTREDVFDIAFHRAYDQTVPYIHDIRLRSQFAVQNRNIFPFWFAQEQFYKRTARSVMFNPAGYRRAQLTLMGMRHTGMLHRGANGEDFFYYPSPPVVQELLAHTIGKFFGPGVSNMPIEMNFTGTLKGISPGLNDTGIPSVAPLIGIGINALGKRFPGLEKTVLGSEGSGKSWWEAMLPGIGVHLVHAFGDQRGASEQLGSALFQSKVELEAEGLGLPDNATVEQHQQWADRVEARARYRMFVRALAGFVAPSAPRLEIDPKHLHKEGIDLWEELGFDDGSKEFARRHPDDPLLALYPSAYLTTPTKARGGGVLPLTRSAATFIKKNADMLRSHPFGAAYLIPSNPSDKSYVPELYAQQLALHLRKPLEASRDLENDEQWKAMKFMEAKTKYFNERDRRDAALKQVGHNSRLRVQIEQQFKTQFADNYLASHPVFADMVESGARQKTRVKVLAELRDIESQGLLASTSKQAKAVFKMADEYDRLNGAFDDLRTRGFSSTRVGQLRKLFSGAFQGWATSFLLDHPDADGFYHAIIEPDLPEVG